MAVAHIPMMLALGGIGLGILGFVFGIWFARKQRIGPLVDRLEEAEKELAERV